jgi:DNA ligase-1
MHQDLKRLELFLTEINLSNSTNHKIQVLEKYANDEFIKKVLYYTYNPYFNYGVTSANLSKRTDLIAPSSVYDNLFYLLADLNERNITGHAAIQAANRFIEDYQEFKDLIYQIIDHNLKSRATTTLINRVIPNLIPTFSVALAHDYTKVKGINLTDGTWYISRKLDGVRCLAIIRNGNISFFSRNGKEFDTLSIVKKEIEALGLNNCVLDGEICLMNENGSDDFQGILKQIQRKDYTIPNPKFWVFDILTLEEFDSCSGKVSLSDRLNRINFNSDIICNLSQYLVLSEESLLNLKKEAKELNWEGLIARRNVGYEGERSKNMLKLKEFYDAEYEVKEAIMETQRLIVNGHEVEEEVLSAVIIEHKGSPVRVGSGFSLDERREYYLTPEKIVGKIICVQYFEETIDQNGNNSLRFPVFKANYGNSRKA